MTTNFEDVHAFHEKYGLTTDPNVGNAEWLRFREKFLEEELTEFRKARYTGDHAEMFDALLDLVYVAMGTADGLGWDWQAGWDRVQAANMSKVRAERDGANSKRGSGFDVVKPAGWKAPDHSDLVAPTQPMCPGCGRSLSRTDVACRRIWATIKPVGEDRQRPTEGVYCTITNQFFADAS
jgi:predicted HAD superfamily Cof-like phosphohydrolase